MFDERCLLLVVVHGCTVYENYEMRIFCKRIDAMPETIWYLWSTMATVIYILFFSIVITSCFGQGKILIDRFHWKLTSILYKITVRIFWRKNALFSQSGSNYEWYFTTSTFHVPVHPISYNFNFKMCTYFEYYWTVMTDYLYLLINSVLCGIKRFQKCIRIKSIQCREYFVFYNS